MQNSCLIHLAAKIRRNKLKWRIASAMLAGLGLLFAFQGFSRAEDDDNSAKGINDCGYQITNPGRYFLAKDLKQCTDVGVSITVSDVKLDLRGHTIEGVFPPPTTGSLISVISANGGSAELSRIDIEGPGTVTLGNIGIDFENVHDSRVHNLMLVANNIGMTVNAGVPTEASTASTDNEFLDNVVTGSASDGIQVNGGNENRFIHNNLSGTFFNGLDLVNATNNVVRRNTADANSIYGIVVGTLGSGNIIEDNIALGNFGNDGIINIPYDLVDQNGDCTHNTWAHNSFNINNNNPTCIQ